MPGGRRGAASASCCQNLSGEVSHHCRHEEGTEKGHVAAQSCVSLGWGKKNEMRDVIPVGKWGVKGKKAEKLFGEIAESTQPPL